MSRVDSVHDRLIPPLPASTNKLGVASPVRCKADLPPISLLITRSRLHFWLLRHDGGSARGYQELFAPLAIPATAEQAGGQIAYVYTSECWA